MLKLKALGYIPMLVYGRRKRGKSGKYEAEMWFPWNTLPKVATEILDHIVVTFEEMLKGRLEHTI